MLRQGTKKQDTHDSMGKYDPKSAQAWAVIMNKISSLRKKGMTLEAIGKRLGVKRATVSRWLSEEFGGEKTTFGDMLRYASALDISYDELIGQKIVKPLDKAVGSVLEEFASDNDFTITDLAKESNLTTLEVNNIFAGETNIDVTLLFKICSAMEANANHVLKRAAKKLEQEQTRDTTANAVRTA